MKKGAPECRMLPLLWIIVDGLCLFLSSPVHLGLTDTDSCLRTLFLCESNSFGSDVEEQISEQNATNDRTEFLQTTEQNYHKQPKRHQNLVFRSRFYTTFTSLCTVKVGCIREKSK